MGKPNKQFLQTSCIVFPAHTDTYSSGDWLPYDKLAMSPTIRGKGYEVYRDALVRRGYQIAKVYTADSGTNLLTSAGHGYVLNQQVRVWDASGGATVPGGLATGTVYYVVSVLTDTFALAATPSGSAIDLTTNGAGTLYISAGGPGCIIQAGGSGGSYPTFAAWGEALLDFCALFDWCFLGHAPHGENIVREIKRRSRRPNGTKVGLCYFVFVNYNQGGTLNTWFGQFDSLLMAAPLAGTGPPAVQPTGWPTDCEDVDPYQTVATGVGQYSSDCGLNDAAAGPGTTHLWLHAVGQDSAVAPNWVELVRAQIVVRYGTGLIDAILVDEINPTRNFGVATNYDSGEDGQYFDGVRDFMRKATDGLTTRSGILFVTNGTGHGPLFGSTPFADAGRCPGRYGEFFFMAGDAPSNTPKTFDQMKTDLQFAVSEGYMVFADAVVRTAAAGYNGGTRVLSEQWNCGLDNTAFNRGPGSSGGIDYGDWPRLADYVHKNKLQGRFVVNAARSSGSFSMHWDPVFGPVY